MKPFFERNAAPVQIKRALSALLFVATSLLLALLAYVVWPSDEEAIAAVQTPSAGWQQSGAANPFGRSKSASTEQAPQGIGIIPASPSLAHTSLAGTQPDGDWGAAANGRLLPNRALRQRFDYYLSLIGELPLAGVRSLVWNDARQALSEPALGATMALWDTYVQLQQHVWKHAVDLRQPITWSAALTERQIVRRHMLGADVAYAFYADEESDLQRTIARMNSGIGTVGGTGGMAGQAAAAESAQVAAQALHPQAAEREAQLQVQWQAWDVRLAAARRQVQVFNQAPELSALQRSQAIENYLSQQFQGSDLIRVRSLLGL